jgi:hypothetical protein
MLVAQLGGPWCGSSASGWATPQNMPLTGCTVPDRHGGGVRLRMDPFAPAGVRAEPLAPAPMPVFTPGGAQPRK